MKIFISTIFEYRNVIELKYDIIQFTILLKDVRCSFLKTRNLKCIRKIMKNYVYFHNDYLYNTRLQELCASGKTLQICNALIKAKTSVVNKELLLNSFLFPHLSYRFYSSILRYKVIML